MVYLCILSKSHCQVFVIPLQIQETSLLVKIEHETEEYSCTSKWKRNDEDAKIVALQANRQCIFVSYSAISLANTRSLISEYAIEDMLPLSTVTSLALKKSVSGIFSAYKQMRIDKVRLLVEENQLVVENEDDAV